MAKSRRSTKTSLRLHESWLAIIEDVHRGLPAMREYFEKNRKRFARRSALVQEAKRKRKLTSALKSVQS